MLNPVPYIGDGGGSVPVGAIVRKASLPGAAYELADAIAESPYLVADYPRLGRVCQGRLGQAVEASAAAAYNFAGTVLGVVRRPGTDEYYSGGANNSTLVYRDGLFGSWTTVTTNWGSGRNAFGATLKTKAALFTDTGGLVIPTSPTTFIRVDSVAAICMDEGNGRLVAGCSGSLKWASNIGTPAFTTFTLAGTWGRVFYCGGNNWVAIASDGAVAKSTDNGSNWTKTAIGSITNGAAPAGFSNGWANDYQVAYDEVNDKLYLAAAGVIRTASFATAATAWTTEFTHPTENIARLRMTPYGVMFGTATETWICKRGTTAYRKIRDAALPLLDVNPTLDGYLGVEGGDIALRMADGINSFDPPRDLQAGELKPYLRVK